MASGWPSAWWMSECRTGRRLCPCTAHDIAALFDQIGDLLGNHCQRAPQEGMLLSINSNPRTTLDYGNLRFRVGQARWGWLGKADVLNPRFLAEVKRLLRGTP
jgi:hypothetical protein